MGPAASLSVPADTRRIDAQGGTLPGLIDSHVHLMFEGINIPKMMGTPFSSTFTRPLATCAAPWTPASPVCGTPGARTRGVKQAVEQGLVAGPRMQISISVLTTTGGHGDGWTLSGNEFNLFPAYPGNPDGRCDGVAEVRKKVREVLRAGAEVIQACSTGGVLSPTDHPEFTQFCEEELRVMVEEAHFRRGIKVMSHAQGSRGSRMHCGRAFIPSSMDLFLDDEAIDLFLAAFLVPTLLAPLAVLEIGKAGAMPDYGIRKAQEVMEITARASPRPTKPGSRSPWARTPG